MALPDNRNRLQTASRSIRASSRGAPSAQGSMLPACPAPPCHSHALSTSPMAPPVPLLSLHAPAGRPSASRTEAGLPAGQAWRMLGISVDGVIETVGRRGPAKHPEILNCFTDALMTTTAMEAHLEV